METRTITSLSTSFSRTSIGLAVGPAERAHEKTPSAVVYPPTTPAALPRPLLRQNAELPLRSRARGARPPKGDQTWWYAPLFNHVARKQRRCGLRHRSLSGRCLRICLLLDGAGCGEVEQEVDRSDFGARTLCRSRRAGGVPQLRPETGQSPKRRPANEGMAVQLHQIFIVGTRAEGQR